MKMKIGRREFDITNKDRILHNGACYILITKKYFKDLHYVNPTVSETQFKKLFKEGKLELISKEYDYTTSAGVDFYITIYEFRVE